MMAKDVSQSIRIVMPGLDVIGRQSGVGRVIHSLQECWGTRVIAQPGHIVKPPIPLIRNVWQRLDLNSGPDVLFWPDQTQTLQAMPRDSQYPSLVLVHDLGILDCEADRQGMDLVSRYVLIRCLRNLHFAQAIVVPSEFTARRVSYWFPALSDKVSVIPNGVSEYFRSWVGTKPRSRRWLAGVFGIPDQGPLLVNVGAEYPRKNMRVLMETFRAVKAGFPNALLVRVGKPGSPEWRADTVRRVERLGMEIGRDVMFLEGVNDETLAHLYQACDLALFPSIYEGFGIPVAEAIAVGAPVIASDRGALPEVVKNYGVIVDPDSKAFIQAALGLLRHEARRSRFAGIAWEEAARSYLDLMTQVVAEHRMDMAR